MLPDSTQEPKIVDLPSPVKKAKPKNNYAFLGCSCIFCGLMIFISLCI